MPCNPLIDPVCLAGNAVKSVTTSATGDVLSGIAQAITAGVRWIVTSTATWWVRIPSPNLAAEPAVAHLQQWLLPITGAVAAAGVIAAGARMAIARRANPLIDVTGGLLTLAAATALGTVVPALLIRAGASRSRTRVSASSPPRPAQASRARAQSPVCSRAGTRSGAYTVSAQAASSSTG
jgi:hypothetical protein